MTLIEQRAKQQTTTRLVDAIKHEHFVLYGQPIVPVSRQRQLAPNVEVFVRYTEEEQKSLPPGGFFEILANLSLTFVLDRWVLSQVVRAMVNQKAAQGDWNSLRFSLNLSVESLHEADFCAHVRQYFAKFQIPAGKLSFEITEHDAQGNTVELKKMVSDLRSIGCGFIITSYTGDLLTPVELKSIGIDAVKIDGQLIGQIEHNAQARSRSKAIHMMCNRLGITTIAERIECPEVLGKLGEIGVDYAQGSAIAALAPLQDVLTALKSGKHSGPAGPTKGAQTGRARSAGATSAATKRVNGERVTSPCALEGMPHLAARIRTLWDHADFEPCVSRLLMDARDGSRQGLPFEAAQELLFLLELAIAKRALVAEELMGVPFAEIYARCLAASMDPRPLGPNGADAWSDVVAGGHRIRPGYAA